MHEGARASSEKGDGGIINSCTEYGERGQGHFGGGYAKEPKEIGEKAAGGPGSGRCRRMKMGDGSIRQRRAHEVGIYFACWMTGGLSGTRELVCQCVHVLEMARDVRWCRGLAVERRRRSKNNLTGGSLPVAKDGGGDLSRAGTATETAARDWPTATWRP